MKDLILLISLLYYSFNSVSSQETEIILDGAIQVGNTTEATPEDGTIRWSGSDLEVWKDNAWTSLTTGFTSAGKVTDIDGHEYRTVTIGNQQWMAENLRTTRYRDGSDIDFVEDLTVWNNLSTGAFSWYDNNNSLENSYGKLYNWFAVEDMRGLCPSGWHIPSNTEVSTLTAFIGGDSVAGGKLKETGTTYWRNPNVDATDEYDFGGRPGGLKSTIFIGEGDGGYYFTTTPQGTSAHFFILRYDQGSIIRSTTSKLSGCSIRCVKNN